jgi:hypothetical protein
MTAPARAPRVIVELAPDGTWIIEHYINGARSRIHVPRGMEAIEVRDCLAEQRRDIERQAAAAAERKAREEASRHSRVYNTARVDHGTYFADRFIGKGNIPPSGAANGTASSAERKAKETARQRRNAALKEQAAAVLSPNYIDLI